MTTKTDITLPPLPGPCFCVDAGSIGDTPGYSAGQLRAYARAATEPYAKALRDLIEDLELRSKLKRGEDRGAVDCGQGAYERAKRALGEWDD